ncbi:MAG: hypothetical protein GY702_16565 [Desulfobulbaceae bacterium]|nr:hypothetical protein [Desulfobulbaceae bacterium]
MPELSGEDVYKKLREINPKIKVLLSSGYSLDGQEKILWKWAVTALFRSHLSCQYFLKKLVKSWWRASSWGFARWGLLVEAPSVTSRLPELVSD